MKQDKSRGWLVKYRGNFTHQQVANMAGISRSYYTEIESGLKNPSVTTAKKIAMVLGFDWTLFFKDDGCETHQNTNSKLCATGTEGGLNYNMPPERKRKICPVLQAYMIANTV
ncbi:helix-turn-helix transcriptional regulator [Desulfofundulus salinus]|uniref:XRE family transcriptional regulator n=1 Tax=Desulfofundulus salinus TaxID=2419843 RepID=A0A494WXV5_9FIRM|nr:helix-turn-helix transcriptional regulator [Desulfofundulus salinum]RKO67142.1 XRE family transcriptional regulator [Desulfofundulus salinum]